MWEQPEGTGDGGPAVTVAAVRMLCVPLIFSPNLETSVGKESSYNAGDPGLIPGLGRSAGEGKDYPLQYPGLENSMDCIVHGVAKSRTRLSDFHFFFTEAPEEALFLLRVTEGTSEQSRGTKSTKPIKFTLQSLREFCG